MKLILTGATGYVGRRLLRHLLDAGARVVAPTRRPSALASDAISHPDRLQVSSIDRLQDVAWLIEPGDTLFHLAALNEIVCAQDPRAAFRVNAVASVELLHAAVARGAGRFIYLSTAHVYGAPLVGEIDERTLPRPVHPYAITHRTVEDYVLAAHRDGDLVGTVFRLSNAVGAPAAPDVDRWSLLANDLCRQAVQSRRLTLKSTGLQERDFIPLTDVVSAIEWAGSTSRSSLGDGLFNLGSGRSLRVLDLACRIRELASERLATEIPLDVPAGAAAPQPSLHFRIDQLRAAGFHPRGSLDAELLATLECCREWF
jgi:UDP-glucose 4-epimerase